MTSLIFDLVISLVCYALAYSSVFATIAEPNQKKILICGVCKNVAPFVENTIKNIEELGSNFKDYRAIIYENNSTDNTVTMFEDWSKQNNRVIFLSENLSKEQLVEATRCFTPSGDRSRTELIARARNIVLSVARDAKYDDFDYLLMADLDFIHAWPITEILNTIRSENEWDCVFANGFFTQDKLYYDRYAFRNAQFPFGPEVLGDYFWQELNKTWFPLMETDNWLSVYSAFGGMGIYKRGAIIPFSYSGHVTENLKIYYKNIFISLPQNSSHRKKYLKLNKMKRESNSNVQILFRNNTNHKDYPVCCEHVTLHASMHLHGFKNMFVNPRMTMHRE